MADREKLLENVKALLRAVLQSNKGGVIWHRLPGEYLHITFEPLPYRKLSFDTIEDFMNSIPDTCRTAYNNEREMVYLPIADKSTVHIQTMVSKQRSKKPKRGTLQTSTWSSPSKKKCPSSPSTIQVQLAKEITTIIIIRWSATHALT